jgi:hypothetical protein
MDFPAAVHFFGRNAIELCFERFNIVEERFLFLFEGTEIEVGFVHLNASWCAPGEVPGEGYPGKSPYRNR